MMLHLASESSQSKLSADEPGDVDPNTIALRIEASQHMLSSPLRISEDDKTHRCSAPVPTDADGFLHLKPGTYEIIMQGLISLGEDEAGFVITRSTLNRNGLFITSGLYDSGYHGVMAGALHVIGGDAFIKKGTRVAQFLLWHAESLNQYDGSYGVGKEHDKKYES